MELSLGFSPCPNDTFIFDALVNGKLFTGDLHFSPHLADVEALNELAATAKLDVTKLSVGAMAALSEHYQVIDSGSALGYGCGPLLVSTRGIQPEAADIDPLTIAIPGERTTANLLLSLAFPGATRKRAMLFSEIEQAVLGGEVDAGLLIHENRFTYAAKGLKKVIDLGEYWEQQFQLPVPLGCIAVRRSLSEEVKRDVSRLIRASVEQAFRDPAGTDEYVAAHAQEMNREVMKKHIELYVNDFSISLGVRGQKAIGKLLEEGQHAGRERPVTQPLFAD